MAALFEWPAPKPQESQSVATEVIKTAMNAPVSSMRRGLYNGRLYAIGYMGPTKKGGNKALLHCIHPDDSFSKFWVDAILVNALPVNALCAAYQPGLKPTSYAEYDPPGDHEEKSEDDGTVHQSDIPKKGDASWSQVQYANAVMLALKHLKQQYSYSTYFKLEHIAGQCDIPKTSYDTMGKALDKLVVIGRVDKGGSGKGKRYRLAVDEWDKYDPYSIPKDGDGPDVDDVTTMPAKKPYAPIEPAQQFSSFDQSKIEKIVTNACNVLKGRIDDLSQQLAVQKTKVEELEAAKKQTCVLKVEKYDGTTITIKDVRPRQFDRVISLVKCRKNVLLFGPAGCGKTHLAEMVSRACGFERFGCISLNAGISDVHILGRAVPNLQKGTNVYQPSEFVEVFEKGGLFLFDELDAADPNVLLCINTALANGYITVPNRPNKPQAKKHPDFLCMATANTIGKGATRQYVGRSQLDEATLDRFRIGMVECDYDDAVEAVLCPDERLRTGLQAVRRAVMAAGLRRIVSTRYLRDAYDMISCGGWTYKDALETLVQAWPDDERQKLSGSLAWAAQAA